VRRALFACRATAATAAACVLACVIAPRAEAAGLYFSDRGVRPMGRAGAYVAGADDLGAIWYNPAGLADAGRMALVDFAWLRFSVEYTRELMVFDSDGAIRKMTSPTVTGSSPVLPIPTMAISTKLGDKWTIAGGVLAPYVALASYADTVNGKPSPARYTMGSFDGTAMAIPGAWVAYAPSPELRLGLGASALVGVFQTTVTFSASPQDRILGAPEQPDFDAQAQLKVGPIVAPSMNAGVIWVPHKVIRFGVSGQLPSEVSSDATLKVRLPGSAIFDGAAQNGTDAHVRFSFPGIVRAGVEVRPTDDFRIEAAYVRELWSSHDAVHVTPRGISLDGVAGMPPQVKLPPISMPRGFTDAHSFRAGGEHRFHMWDRPFDIRFGASYETSAVPPAYLSLSSLDFDKVTISIGGSIHVGDRWRLDAVYAHLFASSVYVAPEIAKIPRVNPLKGNSPYEEPVNGGQYSASADLIGVGAAYTF
jgi:long-chain fatty acid transport protein